MLTFNIKDGYLGMYRNVVVGSLYCVYRCALLLQDACQHRQNTYLYDLSCC